MTEGVMLCSAADQRQHFRKTVFRITVEELCSAEMTTSNITLHSKAVIPIFNVIRHRLHSVVQQQQTIQNEEWVSELTFWW
jgi:hypothetical protein